MTLLLIALSMIYCGGMAMNDCIDCSADAGQRPDRPIPSERITVPKATIVYLTLFASAAAMLWFAGGLPVLAAALLLLLLVLIYNITHSRTYLAVIPMAGCRFMIYIIVGLSFSGTITLPLLLLAIVQFEYIVLLSIVARREKLQKRDVTANSVIPAMLAGIPLIDGIALAQLAHPAWLLAGLAGGAATSVFQRVFRGD
jgi:4-hydroxybenzoate polyprenyltransferase